jgi:hypothetical protein
VKPSVTPDATRAVLADIADAVRPVERARTAAAVDRVLETAAPSILGCGAGWSIAKGLSVELGIQLADVGHTGSCGCFEAYIDRDSLGDLLAAADDCSCEECADTHERYAPWVVSPHLFDTRSDPTPSGSNQRRRVTTEQGGE